MHRQPARSLDRGASPTRRRAPSDHVACVLSGSLRFVDAEGGRAAMSVAAARRSSRRLVGETITLDLEHADLVVADRNRDGVISAHDLLPGDHVRVNARLPRGAGDPPSVVAVRRITAAAPAFD